MGLNREWLWRERDGLPLDDEYIPARLRKPPLPLSDDIGKVLKEYSLQLRGNDSPLSRISTQWPQIVGAELAAKVRPLRYDKPTLYLAVLQSSDLYFVRTQALATIRKSLIPYSTPAAPIRQVRVLLTQNI